MKTCFLGAPYCETHPSRDVSKWGTPLLVSFWPSGINPNRAPPTPPNEDWQKKAQPWIGHQWRAKINAPHVSCFPMERADTPFF